MTPTLIVKKPWVILGDHGRKTTMIETDAGTFTVRQLSIATSIPPGTIRSRLDRYNWSHPCILRREKLPFKFDGGDVDEDDPTDNPQKRDPESIKFGIYEVAVFGKRLRDTKSFKKMIAERDIEYRRQLFATIGR